MSIEQIGVGTSASWKIFLLPDFVEYKFYFDGSPARIGTESIIESLISSVDGMPGTIYDYLPLIRFLILFTVLGLYSST